ncbi:MAG: TIGR00282 family metallophosphoesterase [Deltaproteobacteria bacterium]
MKILFIGDIVGKPGRDAVTAIVPKLRQERGVQFVIANAENAAGGSGITPKVAQELFDARCDVLTSGDHIWKKPDIFELIQSDRRVLRPLNYPPGAPGAGWAVFNCDQAKIGVINLLGRVFMEPLEDPFRMVRDAVAEISKETRLIFVDMHAEATSEKIALGWFLAGQVTAVLGTHTHIQTADERVLPGGTAYLTDAGMTGPYESVIGRKVENVLQRFLTAVPVRFEIATGDVRLCGAIVDADEKTGRAKTIERVQVPLPA